MVFRLFDPRDLITTEDELAMLFIDVAERRLGFARERLKHSPLDDVLAALSPSGASRGWTGVGADKYLDRLSALGFDSSRLHLLLAHPDLVAASPRNLVYYQRLLQMSGKVFGRVFGRLSSLSQRQGATELDPEDCAELRRLNAALAEMAKAASLSPKEAQRTVIRSEGAAVDGDWRNQTGRMALWRTLEALEQALDDQPALEVCVRRRGTRNDIRGLHKTQRTRLEEEGWAPAEISSPDRFRISFGPQRIAGQKVDADLTLAALSTDGAVKDVPAVGEIKGSTDPANAKERWRLAAGNIESMSLLRVGRRQARPTTFYVGNVITEAVATGDSQLRGMDKLIRDGTLDAAFSVVKFRHQSERTRFGDFVRDQLGL